MARKLEMSVWEAGWNQYEQHMQDHAVMALFTQTQEQLNYVKGFYYNGTKGVRKLRGKQGGGACNSDRPARDRISE